MNYFHQVLLISFLESTPVADSLTAECFMCGESPVDIKFEPCGHAMMCSTCAQRAKKCPQCKVGEQLTQGLIHSVCLYVTGSCKVAFQVESNVSNVH
jgi:hypothetical protein